MKASVDKELCIGCGLCVEVCPEVFKMEDNLAVPIVDLVPKKVEESCKDASDQCPVAAIILG
jgi:ferredoxin